MTIELEISIPMNMNKEVRMKKDLIPLNEIGFEQRELSEEEIQSLQLKLWKLLIRRTALYTVGDSSSLPIETAEELLKSICFLLKLHWTENHISPNSLISDNEETILKAALITAEEKLKNTRALYEACYLGLPEIENYYLMDTLINLAHFFKKYDYQFLAHEIPCSIDYPLCHPVSENTLGVEYVAEYLHRLILENTFLRKFEPRIVKELLGAYCPDYKDLLINLYEPVLTNALGLSVLGMDPGKLDINPSDRFHLQETFILKSKKDINKILQEGTKSLSKKIGIENPAEIKYMLKAAEKLSPRVAAAIEFGGLNGIFLSLN